MKLKKLRLLAYMFPMLLPCLVHGQASITVFEDVLFYDGYMSKVEDPVPPGIIRHQNYLYATRLTSQQLAMIGDTLLMKVKIRAACDDYDRLGYVYMSLVPKGMDTYNVNAVDRIELARFITPFMDKNRPPDTILYHFPAGNVASLLRDKALRERYDIWMELSVFGIPYSAQEKIFGCANRTDVFYGSLTMETGMPADLVEHQVLLPLYTGHDLNNYDSNATDEIGKTQLTKTFTLREDLTDAAFFLITSNHGANAGGEEYNRRDHFIYFNDEEVLQYKPGRSSCEPFRRHNTMGNGIYGRSPRSDAEWQSFSNWCPGDVIDTRRINLGSLKAGTHTFRISVPSARFAGREGYIPVSLYLQGRTSGHLDVNDMATTDRGADELVRLFPNPVGNMLFVDVSTARAGDVEIYSMLGAKLLVSSGISIDVAELPPGVYLAKVNLEDNRAVYRKFIKQ